MSVHDQAAVAVLSQVALAADGAVLGLALAYIAVRSVLKYKTTSSALNKVKKAPSVGVSDLRSVLSHSSDQDTDTTSCVDEKLVIVRGVVEAKSVVNGNWKKQNVLVSHESNEKAVILQRTQTCIYNEWRGFFGWTSDFRSLFARHWKEQESSSLRTAFFGHEYPVGLLDEEKILPVGKEITAVGLVSLRNGIPEVMACKDLPFFLSNMSKDQMVVELDFRTKVLLWSGVVIGSLATAILGYSVVRNWNRWKEWRQRRQIQQQNAAEESSEAEADVAAEEGGDVPEGQLCVICLMRQRRSAFVPCGHLVCCPRCALSVERDLSPKCPVCRQTIRSSVRIYDS
ncbi:E3 ubiquitin-protein ligase SPL2 isoform X2 [Cynara cardunculus var. scolymus]|uniref:E3 ubiquitin-protein ligase SPL2 isoform X2 n=1 Tax=Cynara cardunculus var. scolymus TaxID=59895 RepID=UPI000D6241CC|nr:E3 ubiquitin-protein ligase SPL2 isoform X2 [Cynara cardunculus var. scolymus]